MPSTNLKTAPKVATLDPLWSDIRADAEALVSTEPGLASFAYRSVLSEDRLEDAVFARISARLSDSDVTSELLRGTFRDALDDKPTIASDVRADLAAIMDRDPACHRALEPVLYFKGFHAVQAARLAHWLWNKGRKDFAYWMQSRSSSVFGTDIHPAAKIGRGIMFDHATGIIVGETAVISDDVSMLHGVTLGGNGKETGDRHPKVGRGVLIGAGAKILGNLEIGRCARIAAGSVVLRDVPECVTVAGVPAEIVGEAGCHEPARSMNHALATHDFLGEGI
ncbi:MAG: serine O-acetyltransferase [Pseudomonadota bacterium]